jgi:hypothetical protein
MLYAIAGNGVGPNAEITKALADLKEKANQDGVDFWLLLEAKDEPTKIDTVIAEWANKTETWFETITATDAAIEGAQAAEQNEDPMARMLERILERRSSPDAEDGSVLALLPPDDADEDEGLMALIENAIDSDVICYQLNGAMQTLSLADAEEETPEEAAPAPAPAKSAAKKAGAAKKAAAPAVAPTKKAAAKRAATPTADDVVAAVEELPEPGETVVYTEDELKRMGVPELTGIARGQGIDTKGLGKRDLITAIMNLTEGEPEAVAAVIATAAMTNGDSDDVIVIIIPRSKIADLLS